jgi:hypothetical protein
MAKDAGSCSKKNTLLHWKKAMLIQENRNFIFKRISTTTRFCMQQLSQAAK